MSFKIRTKLIIAFFAIILPFIVIGGILVLYSADAIHNSVHKIQSISEERAEITNLILAMDKAIMQANDYIITGERKYVDDFYIASNEVEKGLQKVGELIPAEDRKALSDAGIAWQNIKEAALKIFAIPEPIGNKDAARLMEEMDYKWAYPAIERLKELRVTYIEEFKEASRIADRAWLHSWIVMIVGAFALTVIGIFFAFFYASRFSRPIKAIHNGADVIAGGNFKARLEIKTGDEIEQLSNAMNEMAAQLDSFYSNMQGMVDERTREVQESETRFRGIVETAKDAMICISENGIIYQWNKSAEEMFGYSADEAIGKGIHSLIIPERFHEKANEGFKTFSQTGTGPIIGKTIELVGLKKDGAEFPVELSISAMNIKNKWHAAGIIRDITERKQAEDALRETSNYLESLINYANAPIIVWNPVFKIMRFNHAFEHLTGYMADEVIGKELSMLFPEASREESMKKIIRTSGGEFWESVEIPIIRKDGDIRIALWNSASIYFEDGKTILATIAQGQDFTERKKAEEKLREQLDELLRFQKATVDRELRMHEIKEESERLKKRIEELEKNRREGHNSNRQG